MRLLTILVLSLMTLGFAQPVSSCEAAQERGYLVTPEGWIFNHLDFQENFGLERAPYVAPYLKALADAFEVHETTVVTAVLPTRPMVYAGELSSPEAEASYRALRQTLLSAGFVSPDLLSAFATRALREDVFFRQDHHWTPAGARTAAEEIKRELSALETYQSLEKKGYSTVLQKQDFDHSRSRLENLKGLCGPVGGVQEPLAHYVTQALTAQASGGLFGEVARPDVAYAGTSNGQPWLNFPGALREELSLDVLEVSIPGGASLTSLQKLLASDDYQLDGYRPPFIVWEFNITTTNDTSSEILDFADPLSFRQLIPSVHAQCDGQALLSGAGQGQLELLNSGGLTIGGSSHYLSISSDTPALPEVLVTVRYASGQSETVRLERPSRLTGPSRFFLEFSDFYQGDVVSVALSSGADAALNADICAAPQLAERNYGDAPRDFMTASAEPGVELNNLSPIEAAPERSWRWGLGEKTELAFFSSDPAPLTLELSVSSPVAGQAIDLIFNGESLGSLGELERESSKRYLLMPEPGGNRVELRYADHNHGASAFAAKDPRLLAVVYTQLSLRQASGEEISWALGRSAEIKEALSASLLRSGADISLEDVPGITVSGMSAAEKDNGRWTLGPESALRVQLGQDERLKLELEFFNPIAAQTVELLLNGEVVATFVQLEAGEIVEKRYTLNMRAGTNDLRLRYKDWNHASTTFAAQDSRQLALHLRRFRLVQD